MRTRREIISDLKKIWGENWRTNMQLISENNNATTMLPIEQINSSNNLVWELNQFDSRVNLIKNYLKGKNRC